MTFRAFLNRMGDWLLRTDAMRTARAAAPDPGSDRARAVEQSRLLVEVARRVAEPPEALPPGARPPILIGLYREAAYWALVGGRAETAARPADLKAAWTESDHDSLVRAAGDARTLTDVQRVLLPEGARGFLDETDDEAARARAFAEALVWQLDAPRRQLERVVGQRWSRVVLTGVAVIAAVLGLRALVLGPSLSVGKPFRTSSSWSGCAADPACGGLMFHTNNELNPWVELDLEAVHKIHRIDVTNRTDCCSERAVPLVVQVSTDRVKWTEVGRRDTTFSSWTVKFPPTAARYVKLTVPGQATFHLEEVAVR
jgi:hypothetical protein